MGWALLSLQTWKRMVQWLRLRKVVGWVFELVTPDSRMVVWLGRIALGWTHLMPVCLVLAVQALG